MASCEGDQGPVGPTGPQGPGGPQGIWVKMAPRIVLIAITIHKRLKQNVSVGALSPCYRWKFYS
jgi:hypothetical protein